MGCDSGFDCQDCNGRYWHESGCLSAIRYEELREEQKRKEQLRIDQAEVFACNLVINGTNELKEIQARIQEEFP